MGFIPISVTGGVVKSRSSAFLERGEMVSVVGLRLKPNDLVEAHRELTESTWLAGPGGETIIHMFIARFETAGEFVVIVTLSGANLRIHTSPSGAAAWTVRLTVPHGGTITRACHVQRGDEYFIGTDATTKRIYVLPSSLTVRELGMEDSALTQAVVPVIASPAGGSRTAANDVFVYWISEYDSTNDVESGLTQSVTYVMAIKVGVTAGVVAGDDLQFQFNIGTGATTADRTRYYRHYCGSDGGAPLALAWDEAVKYMNGQLPLVGGLVGNVAAGGVFTDTLDYINDPYPPYPLLYNEQKGATIIDNFLKRPGKFTIARMFNDSLVKANGNVLQYSPSGFPEYQPVTYFMYFATEAADSINGLHVVGDRLLVLTIGGVHIVNYLPYEGDVLGQLGRVQETVSSIDGCVGPEASCAVDTEEGQFVAYMSQNGLRLTDGRRVLDACPDWTPESAGLSAANLATSVLVNDKYNHRLRFYIQTGSPQTTMWDFYYHSSHIKRGRFKAMGPNVRTPLIIGAANSIISGVHCLFTHSATVVYKENQSEFSSDVVITTGQIKTQEPFTEYKLRRAALTHDLDTSLASVTFTGITKTHGEAEDTESGTTPAASYEESSELVFNTISGNYVRLIATIAGHTRMGPIWLDLEATRARDPY